MQDDFIGQNFNKLLDEYETIISSWNFRQIIIFNLSNYYLQFTRTDVPRDYANIITRNIYVNLFKTWRIFSSFLYKEIFYK